MMTDDERRELLRPQPCTSQDRRVCFGCGGDIEPGEPAWQRMVTADQSEHYHTECLIRFLYGAWHYALGRSHEWFQKMLDAQVREAEWRGNHAHVVRLKREAEGKGPRPAGKGANDDAF